MVITATFDEDLSSNKVESEVVFWIRDDINPESTHAVVIGQRSTIVAYVSKIHENSVWRRRSFEGSESGFEIA